MNVIIITGASSGIGMEFALQMDNHFFNVDEFWLIARRQDKLQEVARKMYHDTKVIPMDITQDEDLDRLENLLKEKKAVVRMLVNCAGHGLMGAFAKQDREGVLGMVRLNCEALTNITYRLIPYMKKRSRIIQMASSAAFAPQPDFAVYAATKSYVLSFSRALGEELAEKEIYVTSVCPGPVDTPFFDIAEKTGTTLAIKKFTMVSAEKVVRKALNDSYHRRHLSVCSLPIQSFAVMAKFVPHDVILKVTSLMKMYQM